MNQSSPDTLNWRLVQRLYSDPSFPAERVLRELWRAALNQDDGKLSAQLSDPAIQAFASVAERSGSAAEAAREAGRLISESQGASLAADLARRAAMQSAGRPDARQFFNQRLFAEATNYLVARDIPGHITPGARIESASAAREFRRRLTDSAAAAATERSGATQVSANEWSQYVRAVLAQVSGRGGRRQG